jgi:hypothetical protein
VPVGYLRVNGKLVPDEARRGAVELFATLRATGVYGAGRIAQALNTPGYSLPNGQSFTETQVEEMDLCVAYAGHVQCCDRVVENAHEPLIDASLWARVQEVRAARGWRKSRQDQHYHVLTGLATCPACGAPIWTGYLGSGRQYRCKTLVRGGGGPIADLTCPGVYAYGDTVDELALAWCQTLAVTPNILERAWEKLSRGQHAVQPRRSVAEELRKLRQLFLDGTISVDEFRAREQALQSEQPVVAPRPSTVALDTVMPLFKNLSVLISESSPEHRQAIVRAFIAEAYVRKDRLVALRPTKTAAPLWEAAVDMWSLTLGCGDGPGGHSMCVGDQMLTLPAERNPVLLAA